LDDAILIIVKVYCSFTLELVLLLWKT